MLLAAYHAGTVPLAPGQPHKHAFGVCQDMRSRQGMAAVAVAALIGRGMTDTMTTVPDRRWLP